MEFKKIIKEQYLNNDINIDERFLKNFYLDKSVLKLFLEAYFEIKFYQLKENLITFDSIFQPENFYLKNIVSLSRNTHILNVNSKLREYLFVIDYYKYPDKNSLTHNLIRDHCISLFIDY